MAEISKGWGEPLESDANFTLTVVCSNAAIVLGRKTRGYGTGQLVLPGGKDHYYVSREGVGILPGSHDAAREVYEELGLTIHPSTLRQVGRLYIATEDDNKDVAVYEAHCRQVALQDSDELSDIRWHDEDTLPYPEMPADYKLWLPHVLAGYAATAFLETEEDVLLSSQVYRVHTIPGSRLELVSSQ